MPLFNPQTSSGSSFTTTRADIDVGSSPIYSKAISIIDGRCTTNSQIHVWQDASSNSRSVDENEMDSISFSASPNNGYFTINITVSPGPIVGMYSINYILL